MILVFDSAWGGIAWVIGDGKTIAAKGWKAFPSDGRTLRSLRDWLDASCLPHCRDITHVFIESTNVFGAPDDEDGKPKNFMLQYQVSVRECVQSVAMWCVMRDLPEPEFVFPATWRASFKKLIPKPRPKGATQWKAWSVKLAPQIYPNCLDKLGKKCSEDTADACLLLSHVVGTLQKTAPK